MTPPNAVLAVKYLAVDIVGSFLYFPVWWFTAGAWRMAKICARTVRSQATSFGVAVWLKNLFTPMYGLRDIQGRIISFFMRLFIIIWYSVILLLMSVLMTAVFLAWLALPVLAISQLWVQLTGVLTAYGI